MTPTTAIPSAPGNPVPPAGGRRIVLLVENDEDVLKELKFQLERQCALDVRGTTSIAEAIKIAEAATLAAAVIDIGLDAPIGNTAKRFQDFHVDPFEKWGHRFAGWLREQSATLPIFGITGYLDHLHPRCEAWFADRGLTTWSVPVYDKFKQFKLMKHHLLLTLGETHTIEAFVVYGHDDAPRRQLEAKLKGLGWTVNILGEQERNNESWIKMVEKHAATADLAIVLYTPDEKSTPMIKTELPTEWRPRPNVLLEHGYFLGRYGRDSKRVFLLRQKDVALPSDIDNSGEQLIKTTIDDAWSDILLQLTPWLTPAQRPPRP